VYFLAARHKDDTGATRAPDRGSLGRAIAAAEQSAHRAPAPAPIAIFVASRFLSSPLLYER
jgi:hypothetical protein